MSLVRQPRITKEHKETAWKGIFIQAHRHQSRTMVWKPRFTHPWFFCDYFCNFTNLIPLEDYLCNVAASGVSLFAKEASQGICFLKWGFWLLFRKFIAPPHYLVKMCFIVLDAMFIATRSHQRSSDIIATGSNRRSSKLHASVADPHRSGIEWVAGNWKLMIP